MCSIGDYNLVNLFIHYNLVMKSDCDCVTTGVSPQGIPKGCLCPITSTRAGRQCQNKCKIESNDSEVTPFGGSPYLYMSREGLNIIATIGRTLNLQNRAFYIELAQLSFV